MASVEGWYYRCLTYFLLIIVIRNSRVNNRLHYKNVNHLTAAVLLTHSLSEAEWPLPGPD